MVHPIKLPFTAAAYLKTTKTTTLAQKWIESGVPRWCTLIDDALFVVAGLVFVVASFGFFPGASEAEYVRGCELYVLGSVMYVGLATWATYEILEDSRLSGQTPSPSMLVEQALYVIGSMLFLAGTVDFMPPDVSKGFGALV